MSDYLIGSALLMGASNADDYKTNPTGPLSPAQLADLDRALTPSEQAAVSAWQSSQADAMAVAEHAKPLQPGQHAVSVDFEPGTVIPGMAWKRSFVPVPVTTIEAKQAGIPWWVFALSALGVVVVGGSTYRLISRRK